MTPDELTEHKVFEILTFLSGSDAQFAAAKCALESAEILRKRVRARGFIEAEGTAGERTAEAETADDTQAADDAYVSAKLAFEKLKAHRERGEMLVEVWRSLEASRRRLS